MHRRPRDRRRAAVRVVVPVLVAVLALVLGASAPRPRACATTARVAQRGGVFEKLARTAIDVEARVSEGRMRRGHGPRHHRGALGLGRSARKATAGARCGRSEHEREHGDEHGDHDAYGSAAAIAVAAVCAA